MKMLLLVLVAASFNAFADDVSKCTFENVVGLTGAKLDSLTTNTIDTELNVNLIADDGSKVTLRYDYTYRMQQPWKGYTFGPSQDDSMMWYRHYWNQSALRGRFGKETITLNDGGPFNKYINGQTVISGVHCKAQTAPRM